MRRDLKASASLRSRLRSSKSSSDHYGLDRAPSFNRGIERSAAVDIAWLRLAPRASNAGIWRIEPSIKSLEISSDKGFNSKLFRASNTTV